MVDGQLDWSIDNSRHWAFPGKHPEILVACRNCIGCNTATARDWSVRAFHEGLLHEEHWKDPSTGVTTEISNSCVITLTYDEDHLPADQALHHEDFVRFMKRLRIRRARRGNGDQIRYFMCAEYGGKTGRGHFHAILFGEPFSDRYEEIDRSGQIQQMSWELDELWSQPIPGSDVSTKIGRATVDSFSFAGAAYVAGYVAKKSSTQGIQGPLIENVDQDGVVTITPIQPEYRKMSTRARVKGQPGGLGGLWIWKNWSEVYDEDSCKILQWTFHTPRYYDCLLERYRPDLVGPIKEKRRIRAIEHAEEWTPERCAAAERIALDQLSARQDSL